MTDTNSQLTAADYREAANRAPELKGRLSVLPCQGGFYWSHLEPEDVDNQCMSSGPYPSEVAAFAAAFAEFSVAPPSVTRFPYIADWFPEAMAELPSFIPEEWEDDSWRNDECPKFKASISAQGGLFVWVEYGPPEQQVMANRYLVQWMDRETEADILSTDDWTEVLATVQAFTMNGSAELDPLDSVGTAIRRGATADQIGRIAAAFVTELREDLGESTVQEIRRLNAAEAPYSGICHTHDFCDANMPMADAFESVMGREVDGENDDDCALWGAAWNVAVTAFLTA
jgi:hypothetical protein